VKILFHISRRNPENDNRGAYSGRMPTPAPDAADGGGPAAQRQLTLSHPNTIRALSHPARVLVLNELYSGRSATATELAGLGGVSPSAMSYHLRALARIGLVQRAEASGDGRERPWQSASESFNVDPGSGDADSAAGGLISAVLESFRGAALAGIAGRRDLPAEWQDQFKLTPLILTVTSEEMAALVEQLDTVGEEYRKRPAKAGTRRVHVLLAAVPEPD
jgi:DNA-binding transcriptional ArsR family regulator